MIRAGHSIIFSPEKCVGCKLCYKACFVDVIRWDEAQSKPDFRYMSDCEHCFFCEAVCKKGAIRVVPNYSGERLLQSFAPYE